MWNLNFISENDFKKHVVETIKKYGEKLESFNWLCSLKWLLASLR